MEAPFLGDPNEEGSIAEEANLVFPTAQTSVVQAPAQPTPQQTIPLTSRQQRKCHKGTSGAVTEESTPSISQFPIKASGLSTAPPTNKTPQETAPEPPYHNWLAGHNLLLGLNCSMGVHLPIRR